MQKDDRRPVSRAGFSIEDPVTFHMRVAVVYSNHNLTP